MENKKITTRIGEQYPSGQKMFKMLYLIGPDGLVNLSFENFQEMVPVTMVHVLRFRIKH